MNTPNSSDLPPEIRGSDSNSFAKYTIESRFPHIIESVIKNKELDSHVSANLKQLANEVKIGRITDLEPAISGDADRWHKLVKPYLGQSWYEAPFFFVELYFYRRILEAINYFGQDNPADSDPFRRIKQKEIQSGLGNAKLYAQSLEQATIEGEELLQGLEFFVYATIWSNRIDLSQLPADIFFDAGNDGNETDSLLANHIAELKKCFIQSQPISRVDIVLDNSGIELLADIALACYLLESNLARAVYLHCKPNPVFVSDAMVHDVKYTFQLLSNQDSPRVNKWSRRINQLLTEERLQLVDSVIPEIPLYFSEFSQDIFEKLKPSGLVILKGDVNYRRLVGDRHWPMSTPLEKLAGYFPVNCLVLRVIKSELLVGMGETSNFDVELPENWMTNGQYGILQFI